jgi:uncharacterized DUF497 family protein
MHEENNGYKEFVFCWDEEKNAANIKKHRIDFATAAGIFKDPYMTELYDRKHSFWEDRWKLFGIVEGNLLAVIAAESKPGVIRLISARKADKKERQAYEKK